MNRQRITALDPELGFVSHDRGRTVTYEPDSTPVSDEEAAWVAARTGWQDVEWRDVVGYEGRYRVSEDGRVWSCVTKRVLRPASNKTQYLYVTLGLGTVGLERSWTVHTLVARAFCDGYQPGLQVCHGDGNRQNNRASNLRWGTASDNIQDQLDHGTHPMASKTHCVNGHEFTPENTRYTNGGRHRHCRACGHGAWGRLEKRVNDNSRVSAFKHGQPWSDAELLFAQNRDITAPEAARILGRTVSAVRNVRNAPNYQVTGAHGTYCWTGVADE